MNSAIFRLINLALLAAVLYFVGGVLFTRLIAVDWRTANISASWIMLAFLSISTSRLFALPALRWVILSFYAPLRWRAVAGIAWIPTLAKYLPGKIGSVLGTIWLIKRCGIPTAYGASIALAMTGISVGVGLLLAIPFVVWTPIAATLPYAWVLCLTLSSVGFVCFHPAIFGKLIDLALRAVGRNQMIMFPNILSYAKPVVANMIQWAAMGTSVWLTVKSVADIPLSSILPLISGMALAGTIGFLALFAPAGLGVRDGLLLVVVDIFIGPEPAAMVVVIMRLAQTVSDILFAAIGATFLFGFRGAKKRFDI